MSKRFILFCLVLILALVSFRLMILLPTAGNYQIGVFRMGLHPINDALLWLDCAKDIVDGIKLPGRPIFPLVLTILGFLFKYNYVLYSAFFIFLNIASFLTAFYLLKDLRNNIFIVVFLSFLAMWNAPLQLSLATEVLAQPLLVIAFALIIRSFHDFSLNHYFMACFFIALAQTIRPWDFLSLVTVALFPVFLNGFSKKSLKLTLVAVLSVFMGISFYLFSVKFYCTTESNEVFAIRIWQQAHRGTGFTSDIYSDKNVAISYIQNDNPGMVKALYLGALKQAVEHPENLLEGLRWTFKFFARDIFGAFSNEKTGGAYFVACIFLILLLYFYDRERIKQLFSLKAKRGKAILFIAALVILLLKNRLFFNVFAVIGLLRILFFAPRHQRIFIILYFAGMLLSLLFNGGMGGDREWMSLEIVMYCLLAAGVFVLFEGFQGKKNVKAEFGFTPKTFYPQIIKLYIIFFACLIAIPLFLRLANLSGKDTRRFEVTEDQIRQKFGHLGEILTPTDMRTIHIMWPQPSFERVDAAYCYYPLRYRSFHAFYLGPGQGMAEHHPEYWALKPLPFPRAVYIENKIIFPGFTQRIAQRVEDRDIVVFGKIIGAKRPRFYDEGFLIIAHSIGYFDKDGKLVWFDILK
ncbi:MAG: hypothetical protein MUF05_00280 [Candidatus Omnitrophica bacterium]|jgi:hypothetical protein|nr:hypothetical protein [Candidatus Omnitrophota bacterium]